MFECFPSKSCTTQSDNSASTPLSVTEIHLSVYGKCILKWQEEDLWYYIRVSLSSSSQSVAALHEEELKNMLYNKNRASPDDRSCPLFPISHTKNKAKTGKVCKCPLSCKCLETPSSNQVGERGMRNIRVER